MRAYPLATALLMLAAAPAAAQPAAVTIDVQNFSFTPVADPLARRPAGHADLRQPLGQRA